ncbi:hypothetical protein [Rhodoferax sp. TS-BS-61-7]|uniref:hypothetical protein n=1 Tax=Rhodoferax sp. TS-BS-61-7 TaxID=2094194 RepID=UPI000CF5F7B5|nr:hypothetical protein [Rhodoferax sp. TS-BS-61-7]
MNCSRLAIICLIALQPHASMAQNKCDTEAESAQSKIIREFSVNPPSKHDQAAYLAWSQNLNAALATVGKRHEECIRANRPAISPAEASKMDACLAAVRRRGDELANRYRGRALTFQEQTTQRAEEQTLQDEYMACSRRTNR